MFRSSLPRPGLPTPADRLLRAVPRARRIRLASAVTAAGLAGGVAAAGPALSSPTSACVPGATGGRAPVTFPCSGQPGDTVRWGAGGRRAAA
jgi:hypothetical protein